MNRFNQLYNLAFNQVSLDETDTPAVTVCRVLDKMMNVQLPSNKLEKTIMEKVGKMLNESYYPEYIYDALIQVVKDYE